jgi:hypothetical protein
MPLLLAPAVAPPDLRDRLADLRRRWRRLVLVRAVCLGVAAALAVAVVLGLLDRAVHLPALIRAAALVGLLTAGGLALLRTIRQLRTLNDDLALALRVEEHFPTLNDALASTVQFERHPTGSAALRQATRRYAVREAEDCDFRDLLDRRPGRRALAAVAAAAAVAVPLVLLYPAAVRSAVVRLLDPFGDHAWPPQTVVTLDAPDWLARGEPFILRAGLGGVIPERAMFAFALDGNPVTDQPVPVTAGEDGGSVVVRLEPNRVPRTFRYRLTANDADTGWRNVRVLPPPQLAPLDGRPSPQIRLDFPAYTDLVPRDLPDGGGAVDCVTGTLVRVRAATDRPVARAWVELAPDQLRPAVGAGVLAVAASGPAEVLGMTAAGHAVWGPVPARLDGDGQRFELTFRPYVGGAYLLRFEDEGGLGGRRNLDIRVQPDPSPAVTLERPAASQDSLNLLPEATLLLVARADDPMFAVRRAWLEYRCGKDEPVKRLSLYDHASLGAAIPALLNTTASPLRLRLQAVTVDRRLSVQQFRHADGRPLTAGDTLALQIVADDFDDVTVPKPPGRSHEVELHVVGTAELLTVLQKQEADVQRELKEMLQLQRDALDRTAPAEAERRQTGSLRPDDLERLVQAEQMQQQLRARLGSDQDGLRAVVDRLRRAMTDNPLPRSPERDRLETLAAELDRLAREDLEPVEPLLAQARKERGPIVPEARKAGPLPKAVEHQREAERTLRDLLDQMQPFTDARELRTEAAALARDQEKAARERADLQTPESMGKPKDQLPAEQQKQLDRLAERQSALADRTNDLLGKLNRKVGDKQAAATAKDAEANTKEAQAADLEKLPEAKPADRAKAGDLRQRAQEAREMAAAQRREAEALAAARDAAQHDPQQPADAPPPADPSLAGRQKEAADKLARNEVGEAQKAQEAADRMLKAMQEKLQEQDRPEGDRLAKKQKLDAADRDLGKLIDDQERLQKRAEDAGRIADPQQRKQELDRLSREQEQLQQRARDLAQRLTRLRGEQAGQELRRAARAMEQARDQMDQGEPPAGKQEDALERLDDAQDKLEQTRKDVEEELQREMRAKMLDALNGLKDRQAAQVAESERLFQEAKQKSGWTRAQQVSLGDLASAEATLGGEVGPLVDKHFQEAKVIAHLVRQTADALAAVEPAVEKVRGGPMDLDSWEDDRRTVQNPQRLALKRLTQLIDVMQEDEKDRRAKANQPGGDNDGGAAGAPAGDGIPPLAQLKLLRALQAEVNEKTEAFAKTHTDLSKLTADEQTELDAIRTTQAELAALLDELTPAEPAFGPQPETPKPTENPILPAAFGFADDDQPDRLEKKPRPPEKPAEPPAKPDEKPEDNEKKDTPAEDPAKLREQIAKDMHSAEKKLKGRDPGRDTQQLQDQALRNIDKLIDLARNPPPPPPQQPPPDGTPPPMGGGGAQPQGEPQRQPGTQQRPQSGMSRRQQREQRRRQMGQQARGSGQPQQSGGKPDSQHAGGEQPGNPGQPGTGGQMARRQPDQMSDVVRDIWGHLPETLRQDVDHYYREKFMPHYRELLQEYYSRLAERDRARREDRR